MCNALWKNMQKYKKISKNIEGHLNLLRLTYAGIPHNYCPSTKDNECVTASGVAAKERRFNAQKAIPICKKT